MSRQVRLALFVVVLSAVIAVVASCSDDDDTSPATESPAARPASSQRPTPPPLLGAIESDEEPTPQPQESKPADAGTATAQTSGRGGREADASPIPAADLIVYNTLDGQIVITDPDGSMTWAITPENGFFAWPLWSPDMSRIAFSGTTLAADGTETLSLFVHSLESAETQVVYANEPGMGPILPEMPHYPYWSPDGTQLAFMASVSTGLSLFVVDTSDGGDAAVVIRTAPLYASWSPDSTQLLVHGGADHYLIDVRDVPVSVTNLGASAINYRAPAWSPSGSRMVLVAQDADGSGGLYTSDAVTLDFRFLEETPGEAAFLWSPDGELLALAHSDFPGGVIYRGIRFFSRDGIVQTMRVDEPVMAFFWSPDGSRLAYVTEGQDGFLQWMVLDVRNGERWTIVDFLPSNAQATVLQFFDQFANSHSPWSPDSASLVFSGALRTEGVSVSTGRQQPPQIVVANAGPVPAADVIADGLVAFWSPR